MIGIGGSAPSLRNELDDPNAAPLEQHIKNLECDGVIYRVVKEDPKMVPKNIYTISPSRKAQNM